MSVERISFGKLDGKKITWTLSYDMINYVCDNALVIKPMHDLFSIGKNGLSWEDSDLYKWLNTEFKAIICTTQEEMANIRNVSLLTEGDLSMMYKTDESRIIKTLDGGQNAIWWLRHVSPIKENEAKYVFDDGSICGDAPVNSDGIYVRPIISLFNNQNL